jgi:hypothetical protein
MSNTAPVKANIIFDRSLQGRKADAKKVANGMKHFQESSSQKYPARPNMG